MLYSIITPNDNLILIILLFIFLTLFTLDVKPINIIIDFIFTILLIAILLFSVDTIKISYFSYLLIIIYASAIAILFGFIIMLYNNINKKSKSRAIHRFEINTNISKPYLHDFKDFFTFTNINFSFLKLDLLFLFILLIPFIYIIFTNVLKAIPIIDSIYNFIISENIYVYIYPEIDIVKSYDTLYILFTILFNNPYFINIILIIILLLEVLIGVIYLLLK